MLVRRAWRWLARLAPRRTRGGSLLHGAFDPGRYLCQALGRLNEARFCTSIDGSSNVSVA